MEYDIISDRYPITMKTANGYEVSVINADTTATGLPSRSIESIMASYVPSYSNTHSNTLLGNRMTTEIDHVRDIVAMEFNVSRKEYDILFPGNGCTMAVKQLIHILGIVENPSEWYILISENEHHAVHLGCLQGLNCQKCVCKPYVTSTTHHGLTGHLLVVPIDSGTNMINRDALVNILSRVPQSKHILCFFNHTSNVTGSTQNVKLINTICRRIRHDVIIAWDYACSFPYMEINPYDTDAIVCSPHKCMGGNGTPGLLIVRKSIHLNNTPFVMAGGITQYICDKEQILSFDQENLESAGSPNGLGIIRIGEVLKKRRKTLAYIKQRNQYLAEQLYTFASTLTTLKPLDSNYNGTNRLPIISLVSTIGIHYNLYCAVLSDFYGIMTRGGISCCTLLYQKYRPCCREKALSTIITGKGMPCTYGGIRITLNYAMTDNEVSRIFMALHEVDLNIQQYIPLYRYNPKNNHYELKE